MSLFKKFKNNYSRYTVLTVIAIFIFSVLILKLIFMQILDYQRYLDQSNTDAVKEISEPGPRGDIVDRNGVVLATDIQSYVVTFMQTDESKRLFFETMEQVFAILEQRNEPLSDEFALKYDGFFSFDFESTDSKVIRTRELRFKKDRGLDQYIINNTNGLKNKSFSELSVTEQSVVDEKLLAISAEETFGFLWEQYTEWFLSDKSNVSNETKQKIANFSTVEKRNYMLVLDALKMQSYSGYKPVAVAEDISRDTAFIFKEKLSALPGIDSTEQPKRYYPFNDLASAVLGNIAKIGAESQTKYKEKDYDVNTDLVGAAGIEGALEDRLKGTKGGKIVEVNKVGQIIKEKARKETYPGEKVQLTISKDLQYVAEKSLDKALKGRQDNANQKKDVNTANANRGAVVVLDVNTGEVLAMASRPGYDPNMFAATGGLTTEQSKQYFGLDYKALGKEYIAKRGLLSLNPDKSEEQLLDWLFPVDKSISGNTNIRKDDKDIFPKPFYNYATMSLVPPGSTFKPVTAIAGLETGVVNPGTTVVDNKEFNDGNGFLAKFPNDAANGVVNLNKALAVSSNPYFMSVAKKMRDANLTDPKDDILAEYAWKLGLGVKPNTNSNPSTGIEISENFGQVYNTYTAKNIYATTYLSVVMDALKSGKGSYNNSFVPIDLYDNSNDIDEVKKIKKEIKTNIQDSIKNGGRKEDTYRELLTKLVKEDESYKDIEIKKSDYDSYVKEIGKLAVDTANFEATKIGGNIYNASIGQGLSQFTPIQLASYVATLVNGGNRYKTHLVKNIYDVDGTLIEDVKPEILSTTGFSQSNIDAIKQGMKGVTSDSGTAATAFQGFDRYLETGGKTGTATYSKLQDQMGRSAFALFAGFAPYDKPEIAVCAVMFDGGYGSYAAPIVKNIYEAYFMEELKGKGYTPTDDYVKEIYDRQ